MTHQPNELYQLSSYTIYGEHPQVQPVDESRSDRDVLPVRDDTSVLLFDSKTTVVARSVDEQTGQHGPRLEPHPGEFTDGMAR